MIRIQFLKYLLRFIGIQFNSNISCILGISDSSDKILKTLFDRSFLCGSVCVVWFSDDKAVSRMVEPIVQF